MRKAIGLLALSGLLVPAALHAQAGSEEVPAPPPSGITPSEPTYALGVGMGALSWDDDAPYEGVSLASLGIERRLSAFGISTNALPGMAAAAMTVQRLLTRNLREVTEADALAIYEAAL